MIISFDTEKALDKIQQQFMIKTPRKIRNKGHACKHIKLLESSPSLCDPMDCAPPGSPVHGILQARILEWVVMPSSRGSSQPRGTSSV